MEKYNEYRDSGVVWFEKIPNYWNSFRFIDNVFLKHGYQFRDYDFTDNGISIVKISQLNPNGYIDLSKCSHISSERLKSFQSIRIYQDDILMALTGGTIGKIIKVGEVKEPILQNYRVGNFFPNKKKLDKTFLYFLLSSKITEEQINYLLNRNGQPNIGKESFKNMYFPLPPLIEQNEIANYLDTKTAAIDKKISLLQQKIKHYKAYRKTLINETVTKGLDKTVKLKDSGIDWIGKIPEHWEVKRIKDIFSISRGRAIGKTELKDKGKYPVYSSQTKNRGILGYIDTYDFNNNLLTWTTDGVNAGTVFIREGKFNCTNICGTLIPKNNPKLHLDYMAFAVQESTQHNKRIDTNGAKIMSNEMAVIDIVFPPVNEQRKIAERIKLKTETISKILNNIETQITTLKELRKTLINEVVTGKVKVST